jgi:hypothetical protein
MEKSERIKRMKGLSKDNFFSQSSALLRESLRDAKATSNDHRALYSAFEKRFSKLFKNPSEGDLAMARRTKWNIGSKSVL